MRSSGLPGRKIYHCKADFRFYPVDGGEILIGGKNIQSYSEKALIQNIAFVFQRSQLLKTSIYENVRIGNPQATRQQIMDALDAANCTSILDKFPSGR